MTDKKIGDDILRIPAISLAYNIFWPGNEYEMKINKLPEIPEKTFLKFKTILNERFREQMEIAIVFWEQPTPAARLREWGVLARIIGLSSLKIDAQPFYLRARIMGRCQVLRFFKNEEQDGCTFADVRISPVLAISEEKWQSDEIQKLKRDIVEDFYDFFIVCAEISEALPADNNDNKDLKQKFVLLSLFSQRTSVNIELCADFEGLVKSVDEWLEDVFPGSKEILDLKFLFLSLNDQHQQMLMIKNMIDNFVGLMEKRLPELEGDSLLTGSEKNFSLKKDSLSGKEELLKRLEDILKRLNALIKKV